MKENGTLSRDGTSIVVLVGPIAAGKGTAAELLIEQGYVPFNYGDIIYEERTAQGLSEERKHSNAVGASLRLRFGNDIIAKRIAESVEHFRKNRSKDKILIDGLRHPDEVMWMKENMDARVLGITASPEVRFQRSLQRGRVVDPKSPDDFIEVDHIDRGLHAESHENKSDACLLVADVVIENNGDDLSEYLAKIRTGLENLGL